MSETKSERKKREAKKILSKFYVVLSLLVQAFRIFGTAIIFYNEIDVIVLKVSTGSWYRIGLLENRIIFASTNSNQNVCQVRRFSFCAGAFDQIVALFP